MRQVHLNMQDRSKVLTLRDFRCTVILSASEPETEISTRVQNAKIDYIEYVPAATRICVNISIIWAKRHNLVRRR